jgi:hypothetical protein
MMDNGNLNNGWRLNNNSEFIELTTEEQIMSALLQGYIVVNKETVEEERRKAFEATPFPA